ncbi:uncharacterized protein A4U43_C07F19010 [Asparagus officinalis]|uniref:Uncharacterized protein n=1 Tax=Asparagus officinalis TaxID=4686 RepID=A0A5P1EDA0_ASPOF|nr:uncharacterized protein LOC109850878 [Asparagus officinalis]ONK63794.1 uncharacterized protein A4U43_C07F19010 [Asparagus officinalis]
MEFPQSWRSKVSYKNATILICCLNLVAVFFLLHGSDRRNGGRSPRSDPSQGRYFLEAEEIRRAMEPVELIKRIKEIGQEVYSEPGPEIKQAPKQQTAAVDLSKRLKDRAMNDDKSQRALEEWRIRKMERARLRETGMDGTVITQT